MIPTKRKSSSKDAKTKVEDGTKAYRKENAHIYP